MATCFHTEDNLLFLERLRDNKSLRRLNIRGTQCGFHQDLLLEDSLGNYKTSCPLQEIDLGDNPHGIHGLRALLRLVCRPNSKVVRFHLDSLRDAPNPAFVFSYQGSIRGVQETLTLNLAEPHHRALLRMYQTV